MTGISGLRPPKEKSGLKVFHDAWLVPERAEVAAERHKQSRGNREYPGQEDEPYAFRSHATCGLSVVPVGGGRRFAY
jgi:hypothetical protein